MLPAKPATDNLSRPTIRLEVTLDDTIESRMIDFMQLTEQKYGYDVVHPEVKAVAFDLANDDDNDDDNDEDEVDLNAPSTSATGEPNSNQQPQQPAAKPRNRGKVEGKYDLNDPFIDDTEMLWEEQAASTKDGFFVYSGPLRSEKEPVPIEKADAKSRRGAGNAPAAGGITKPKPKRKAPAKEGAAAKKKVTKKKPEPTASASNGASAPETSRSSTPKKTSPSAAPKKTAPAPIAPTPAPAPPSEVKVEGSKATS